MAAQGCEVCRIFREGLETQLLAVSVLDWEIRKCEYLCPIVQRSIDTFWDHADISFPTIWRENHYIQLEHREHQPLYLTVYGDQGTRFMRGRCLLRLEIYGIIGNILPKLATESHLKGEVGQNLSVIQDWLRECDNNHRFLCGSNTITKLPKRVLDLEAQEDTSTILLIETSDEYDKYIALSHCWGKENLIKTTRGNLYDHLRGISVSSLPKTFQDAIAITRQLGIRYIWIDSLCIIQDNKTDWEVESAKMAEIYSQCYVNISATRSSDGRGGCFGTRWLSGNGSDDPTRDPVDVIKRESVESLNFTMTVGSHDISLFIRLSLRQFHNDIRGIFQSKYSCLSAPLLHRGWYLQERALSPRTIHYGSAEIVWECRSKTWCECGGIIQLSSRYRPQSIKNACGVIEMANKVDVHRNWRHLVDVYSSLDLTYESDRLPAFSGLASCFQGLLKSRCLAGLWEDSIACDLLWQVKDKPAQAGSKLADHKLPTWSWAAGNASRGSIANLTSSLGRYISLNGFESCVELRSVNISSTSGNWLGGVSGGTLIIYGLWTNAIIIEGRRTLGLVIIDQDEDDWVIIGTHGTELDYNPFEESNESLCEGQIVCLLHIGQLGIGETAVGLVLRSPQIQPTTPDTWERIGILMAYNVKGWNEGLITLI